jgi:hypothetical protein
MVLFVRVLPVYSTIPDFNEMLPIIDKKIERVQPDYGSPDLSIQLAKVDVHFTIFTTEAQREDILLLIDQ